jgi:serine/threonine protein kinase
MGLENSLVLGRYRVLWLLEQERLTNSYIARDEYRDGSGEPVLIKHFLHEIGAQRRPDVRALYDDLTVLTHLRHPGVVPLLDFGIVDDCLVTAHAHSPGVFLPQLCDHFSRRNKPFPPHLALFIVRQLLSTLQYCHTRAEGSLVHGRITLGCVYLASAGESQLADFALAGLEDVATEAESQLGFFQTRMSYAAPEITRGGPPSATGDVYALALLLYRMLAGTNPFRGRSIPETLQRVLQLKPAALVIPSWNNCAAVNRILDRALEKDPEVRFQSCQALGDALDAISEPAGPEVGAELLALIRESFSADWAQIARLTRSVRRSLHPSGQGGVAAVMGPQPLESRAPAFVSGLLTDQPVSATEHTKKVVEETQASIRRRTQRKQRGVRGVAPTVFIPAAAIILGLFLGRLGEGGEGRPPVAPTAASGEARPLVKGPIHRLRAQLRSCVRPEEARPDDPRVELEFVGNGELSAVRLKPASLARTRLGACLLHEAWNTPSFAPGAVSVVIPLFERTD